VVLACDLPYAQVGAVGAVGATLDAAPGADAAIPVVDDRRQYLHAAYRRRTLDHWLASFEAGERSLHRPCRQLAVVEVAGLDGRWLRDADRPGDLPDRAV
jgi:molybdopterin-guanine dinucleotide biosynthesis protein A